jgi:hypothetical protein
MKLFKNKFTLYISITISLILIPAVAFAIKFPDPLNARTPLELFARVIQALLGFVGVWALLNFTIAGIGIITAQGVSEKIERNKETLKWTVIGIGLIFGAYAIISYFIERFAALGGIGGI